MTVAVPGMIGAALFGILRCSFRPDAGHYCISKSIGFVRFVVLALSAAVVGCTVGLVGGFIAENVYREAQMSGEPDSRFARAIAKVPLKLALCDLKNAEVAKPFWPIRWRPKPKNTSATWCSVAQTVRRPKR